MRFASSLLLFSAMLVAAVLPAQSNAARAGNSAPSDSNVAVRLIDGSLVYGTLERHDADSVVVVSLSGRSAFATASVRDVKHAGQPHTGSDGKTEYWFDNANATRLFFAPTGRTLNKGQAYIADHDVVLGSLSVGVTDRVTLGGGSFLFPSSDFWFVTPKVGLVRGAKVNIAAGALIGSIGDATGGIGFVSSTVGSVDNSVTIAVGEAFHGSTLAQSQVFMIGGERRVAKRLSLVTENYFASKMEQPVVSYGVRFLGEKTSIDLAFINVAGKDVVFPGIPYVDFVIRF